MSRWTKAETTETTTNIIALKGSILTDQLTIKLPDAITGKLNNSHKFMVNSVVKIIIDKIAVIDTKTVVIN